MRRIIFILGLLWMAAGAWAAGPEVIEPANGVFIPSVGRFGRMTLPLDPVMYQMAAGKFVAPKAGDKLKGTDGSALEWKAISVGKDKKFSEGSLRGGYLFVPVESEEERVMLLEISGYVMAYVNGEERAGDVYQTGWIRLPVLLRKGTNDLLIQAISDKVGVKLTTPAAEAQIHSADPTLPSLIAGVENNLPGAVVVLNNSKQKLSELTIRATVGEKVTESAMPAISPLTMRKVAFAIKTGAMEKKDLKLKVEIVRGSGEGTKVIHEATFGIAMRNPTELHNVTFISEIDGSVQYYAVRPAKMDGEAAGMKAALYLTLHGASVQADGQAAAYASKANGHIVAPTNRRPYGFDWEDWGRMDAMEVLGLATKSLNVDEKRVYLTGHSMGGHGTWHLGVTYPDRFAAIGPSAGWVSMFSYAGMVKQANPTPMQEILRRCSTPSDTLALAKNLTPIGVYILHGDADDNVPVSEARSMKNVLAQFHQNFAYYEQPGAGHWWSAGKGPATDCVDWPRMFEFFAHHTRPALKDVKEVDFTTASPGVSATNHWATVVQQEKQLLPSNVHLKMKADKRTFSGTTENVARLAIDCGGLKDEGPVSFEIDGTKLNEVPFPKAGAAVHLKKAAGKWEVAQAVRESEKNPSRSGTFKSAFNHRVVLVYATGGSAEENAWAYAKARYDAEIFYYRGNGSMEIVADTEFDATKEPDRSVVLYGNSETNKAWGALLKDSPVQVNRAGITVGEQLYKGEERALLMVRPRPGSAMASVGVVGGSGVAGCRLTDRLPYFSSGVAYPDVLIFDTRPPGIAEIKVRAAGFFGNDWSIKSGELVVNP